MELAVTLLIVALAAAVVLRRTLRLFRTEGRAGCGSGCGSCPVNGAGVTERPLVSLDLPKRR
jgi:hypothetical protein